MGSMASTRRFWLSVLVSGCVVACTTCSRASTPGETVSSRTVASAVAAPTISTTLDEFPLGHGTVSSANIDTLPFGAADCTPASPLATSASGFPEVRGTTTTGTSLYALVMPEHNIPLRAHDNVKIVWRMTGAGALSLVPTAPDGTERSPAWGPEAHDGSNYQRPGAEWGSGFVFATPGCWHIHATRTDSSADVWLPIDPL